MGFHIRTGQKQNRLGLDESIWIVENDHGQRAEIWPALGFNCFRWHVREHEVLFADRGMTEENRPTRSGIPVLFPFPNRIRQGRFSWEGKEYHLPLNDTTKKNAIHAYACRKPWRVVGQGTDAQNAWITGEFQGSVDAPETMAYWPSDHRLRLTYRLLSGKLRIEAVVDNPDRHSLPFGLGYHPYFHVGSTAPEETEILVPARKYWVLEDSLPVGETKPVADRLDLQNWRKLGALQLDDVLTDLFSSSFPMKAGQTGENRSDGFFLGGAVRNLKECWEMRMSCTLGFREMVVFTPPHRQAVCLEPYTCVTDAINLQRPDLPTGLLVLQPGSSWKGTVELEFLS